MASIGELFVSLGFDVDTKKLDEFNDRVKDAQTNILKMAAVATTGITALGIFLDNAGRRAVDLQNFTTQTGYSAEALQKWALAANMANNNFSLNAATASYKNFASQIQQFQHGIGGFGTANALGLLGVNASTIASGTPEAILEELSRTVPGLIKSRGLGYVNPLLQNANLSPDWINTLLQSDAQRDAETRGKVIPDSVLNNAAQFRHELTDLSQKWDAFQMKLAANIGPEIARNLDDIEQALEKMIPKVEEGVQALGGWKNVIEGIIAISLARWALAMVADFALIGLAITPLIPVIAALTAALAALYAVEHVPGGFLNAEKKGLSLLWNHPGQFFDNLGAAIDIPMKKYGVDDWLMGMQAEKLQRTQSFLNPSSGSGGGIPSPPGSPAFAGVTNNNTFNIHGTEADAIAEATARALAQQNQVSLEQLNQGPPY